MNFEKFRDPPQKKVTGSWWSATRVRTRRTSQMWCSCAAVSVASPVSGSPWYASSLSPLTAW